jgi:hypothetical protein
VAPDRDGLATGLVVEDTVPTFTTTKATTTMESTDPTGELRDAALADEISLLGELVLAAAGAGGAMTQAEVDEALGLSGHGSEHQSTEADRSALPH